MHRARYNVSPGCATFPAPAHVPQPGNSPNLKLTANHNRLYILEFSF